jgi:hypothetical protein
MSSDEEVAVCLWYTLQELEKKQKKKLWVHPLNQKRITLNVIFSLLCELRADESKFKNYTHYTAIVFYMYFILTIFHSCLSVTDEKWRHFRR